MIITITALTCDHKDRPWSRPCYVNVKWEGTPDPREAIKAVNDGWRMYGNRTYCPTHAPLHPTHGTVEEEMEANGYVADVDGKMHIPMNEVCRG